MITNNLLLRLKQRDRETIAQTRDMLLSMQGRIGSLRDLQVKVNIRHTESSYDIALFTTFDSIEGLNDYLVHPVHVEVSKYIAGVLASGAAVCFDS